MDDFTSRIRDVNNELIAEKELRERAAETAHELDEYRQKVDQLKIEYKVDEIHKKIGELNREANSHMHAAQSELLAIVLDAIYQFTSSELFSNAGNNNRTAWAWLKENFEIQLSEWDYKFEHFYEQVQNKGVDEFCSGLYWRTQDESITVEDKKYWRGDLDGEIELNIPRAVLNNAKSFIDGLQKHLNFLQEERSLQKAEADKREKERRMELYKQLKAEFENDMKA